MHCVLVVDDSVGSADALREILHLEGYEAHAVYGATQCLDRVRAVVPDVVICDLGLPEIDGLRLARMLRSDDRLARTTLVAVTGYGGSKSVATALAAGFDAHFTKPIIIDDLLAALGKLTTRGG